MSIKNARPNKNKVSVFRVPGLKILCRVGSQIFVMIFFSGKKYNFMHFEWYFALQNR